MDGLGRWAAARTARTTEQALAALAQMHAPDASQPDHRTSPFPWRNKEVYEAAQTNSWLNSLIAGAPVRHVSIMHLAGIQPYVKASRVADFIRDPGQVPAGSVNPRTDTPNDLPIVVKRAGTEYIHDGHHRLTAAVLRGEPVHPVRYVDLDALEGREALQP